jgi:hypothetical protein
VRPHTLQTHRIGPYPRKRTPPASFITKIIIAFIHTRVERRLGSRRVLYVSASTIPYFQQPHVTPIWVPRVCERAGPRFGSTGLKKQDPQPPRSGHPNWLWLWERLRQSISRGPRSRNHRPGHPSWLWLSGGGGGPATTGPVISIGFVSGFSSSKLVCRGRLGPICNGA